MAGEMLNLPNKSCPLLSMIADVFPNLLTHTVISCKLSGKFLLHAVYVAHGRNNSLLWCYILKLISRAIITRV